MTVHGIAAWRRQSDAHRTDQLGVNSWQRQRPWQAPERRNDSFQQQ